MKTYAPSPARKLKPEAVVLHPHEPVLVINYAIVALGTAAATAEQQQKFVRLDPRCLASYDDCVFMAGQLVDQSKYLVKSQRSEVEQLLHQLYRRHQEAVAAADQSSSSSSSTPTPHANMANLDTYLEMLYDDTHKIEGTAKILELTRDVKNLEALLLGHPTVPSALARILGDYDSRRRDLSLLYNILRIFLVASHFHEMQKAIVTEHRVGSLTMRALEGKLPDVLQSELAGGTDGCNGEKHFTVKGRTTNVSHSSLFFVGLWLLLNLATGNAFVEEKMVKKQLIPRYLLPFLADNESKATDSDLRILVLTFLKRLSVYKENVQQMADGQLVPTLVKLIYVEVSMPESSSTTNNGSSPRRNSCINDERIIGAALGILYNLAFDSSLRQAMVVHGLLPKLVGLLRCKQTWRAACLKLLYVLSFDNETKLLLGGSDGSNSSNSNAAAMASSSVIPLLKELIFHLPLPSLPDELAALAVNLTFEANNVEQLCAKAGLRRLMDRVIRYRDPLVLKIVRNVSQWSLASQGALTDPDNEYQLRNLWPSHIKPLLALLGGSSLSASCLPSVKPGLPMLSSSPLRPPQAVVLEALGTLANLTPLDLPVGMQWHDFAVPSLLHPAQTQSEQQQQHQPQTVWLYCREWLLALVSCLRVRIREMEEVDEEEKEVVDMLLQILLLLQTLALDPVHLNDMTSDETFLEALHSVWRAHAQDEPELGLQSLVLVHRLLLLSLPSPISWYGPHYRQDILNALWHASAEVRRVANQCVECFVEDGRRADEGRSETMVESLQQARFEAHNAEWCARINRRERM